MSIDKIYKCPFCDKSYKHRQSQFRHTKKCPYSINDKPSRLTEDRDTQETQEQQKPFMMLNDFNNPDYSFLTEEDLKDILESKTKRVVSFIKKVYFNKQYPLNHTVYIDDPNHHKYGYIYTDNKWCINYKHEIIKQLIRKTERYLSFKVKEMKKNESEYYEVCKNLLIYEYRQDYKDEVENKDGDCDAVDQEETDSVEMLLHNYKHLPKDIRKRQGDLP